MPSIKIIGTSSSIPVPSDKLSTRNVLYVPSDSVLQSSQHQQHIASDGGSRNVGLRLSKGSKKERFGNRIPLKISFIQLLLLISGYYWQKKQKHLELSDESNTISLDIIYSLYLFVFIFIFFQKSVCVIGFSTMTKYVIFVKGIYSLSMNRTLS